MLLELPNIERQLGEDLALTRSHLLRRKSGSIQPREPRTSARQELDEYLVARALLPVALDPVGLAVESQPALEPGIFHRHRECLVELGVVRNVQQLVGELVEEDRKSVV